MAWICSCGVHNAESNTQCRWCGKPNPNQLPASPSPAPATRVIYVQQPPPPEPPVYYPQQRSGPMAGYPLRSSAINDLRAMGGTGAARLGFGASMGIAAGWTIGKFLGCLGILLLIAILCAMLGVIGSIPAWLAWHKHEPARHHQSGEMAHPRLDPAFAERNSIPISPNNPYRLEGNYSGWPIKKAERAHREFLRKQREWELDHPRGTYSVGENFTLGTSSLRVNSVRWVLPYGLFVDLTFRDTQLVPVLFRLSGNDGEIYPPYGPIAKEPNNRYFVGFRVDPGSGPPYTLTIKNRDSGDTAAVTIDSVQVPNSN